MSQVGRILAGLATGLALTGCSLGENAPAPPAPPRIEVVGILADYRIADPKREIVLEDGRTFEISTDVTRVLFDGDPGHPFVIGSDDTGPFVAGFVSQNGRPANCHVVPAGGGLGIERGAFIETEGILWRKAADFRSEVDMPALGQPYVGLVAFCFNERAEVFAAAAR